GHFDRRRIAALAGLALLARDSGAFRGRRMIGGGRAYIRRILYMATVAAIKFNPVIRAFFHRLLGAGPPRQSRRHGRHAEAPHHPERDAPRPTAIATHLTRNTVAQGPEPPGKPGWFSEEIVSLRSGGAGRGRGWRWSGSRGTTRAACWSRSG